MSPSTTPRVLSATVALGLGLAALPATKAALIVYDGFNYTLSTTSNDADAGLNGGNGLPYDNTGGSPAGSGTGLRNNWATGTIVAGLTYSGLETSGNAYQATVSNDVGTPNNPFIYRNMTTDPYASLRVGASTANPLGADGTTLYFSFLFQVSSVPTNNNSDRALLQLVGGSSARFNIGLSNSSSNADKFSISNSAGGVAFSTVSAAANTTYFLVAELTSVSGHDTMKLWVNPTPGGTLGSADATLSGVDFDGFLQFSPRFQGTGVTMIIDEVRIGTTYADVSPVPEPSAFAAIAGLGALGMVATRRRRR